MRSLSFESFEVQVCVKITIHIKCETLPLFNFHITTTHLTTKYFPINHSRCQKALDEVRNVQSRIFIIVLLRWVYSLFLPNSAQLHHHSSDLYVPVPGIEWSRPNREDLTKPGNTPLLVPTPPWSLLSEETTRRGKSIQRYRHWCLGPHTTLDDKRR